MNVPEVFQTIKGKLDQSGITYMLTGSFASAYYGAARSTQDIDLVIEATGRDNGATLPAQQRTRQAGGAAAAVNAEFAARESVNVESSEAQAVVRVVILLDG